MHVASYLLGTKTARAGTAIPDASLTLTNLADRSEMATPKVDPCAEVRTWDKKVRYILLRHGDAIPEGRPGMRTQNGRGYIQLRWTTGPREVTWAYEHRVVMGLPPETMHVHHVNGNRGDNRPENLQIVEARRHLQMHNPETPKAGEIIERYRAGDTMELIAVDLEVNCSTVCRVLQRHGIAARTRNETRIIHVDDDVIRFLHEGGLGVRKIAAVMGFGTTLAASHARRLGLSPLPGGPLTAERIARRDATITEARRRGMIK